MSTSEAIATGAQQTATQRAQALLAQMTLAEKIGQMAQVEAGHGYAPEYLGEGLRAGRIGSVINIVDVDAVNDHQRDGPGQEGTTDRPQPDGDLPVPLG